MKSHRNPPRSTKVAKAKTAGPKGRPIKAREASISPAEANRIALCALIEQLDEGMGEIAKRLDVNPRTLYAWRHGKNPVPRIVVLALRTVLTDKHGHPMPLSSERFIIERIVCRKPDADAGEGSGTILEFVPPASAAEPPLAPEDSPA